MNLAYLQKQGRAGHLFIAHFPGWGDVPFKLPSVKRAQEYSAAFALGEATQVSGSVLLEQLFRECVVDEDLAYHEQNIPAGIVDSVGREILFLSGVSENIIEYTQNLFNTYRAQVQTMVPTMKRVVCSVFGGHSLKDADELDYQDLCEMFIQAERALLDGGVIEEPYRFGGGEQRQADFSEEAAAQQAALEGRDPSTAKSTEKDRIFKEAQRNTKLDKRIQKIREQKLQEAKKKSAAVYRRG